MSVRRLVTLRCEEEIEGVVVGVECFALSATCELVHSDETSSAKFATRSARRDVFLL